MTLPKTITPSPIVMAAVEIRFNSDIPDEDVMAVFYPILSNELPKHSNKDIFAKELKKKNIALRYMAESTFSNEKFSVSVGTNVLVFENIGVYSNWEEYFLFMKNILDQVAKTSKVTDIARIGVRYANIFENQTSISEALNIGLSADFQGYTQDVQNFRTEYKKGDTKLFLQAIKKAKFEKKGSSNPHNGLYVDIDASIESNLPKSINNETYKMIDYLHSEIKTLLFNNLIKQSVKDTLNITY
jgi:uncharacterized protein (TIGR04255 family)